MTTIEAGRYVLDTIQRYRLGDLTADEYRERMTYVRDRASDADYQAAKMWAAAHDAR